MLLLTYPWRNRLGCINLARVNQIYINEIDLVKNDILMTIDNVQNHYDIGSIITSFGSDLMQHSVTLRSIFEFEKENLDKLIGEPYESMLPQLIMLYVECEPGVDFFTFVKKEYMKYINEQNEEIIDTLP